MAYEKHLAKLKRGVDIWNKWRRSAKESIDLSGADLFGAALRGALLNEANLSRANLSRANLGNAHLIGADLSGSDLSGSDLHRADLMHADLRGAHFVSASLRGADLSGTFIGETLFADTDLTSAVGLDKCQHYSNSTLDHRTLAKSGVLPLVFLRGCGLPESFITYLPSLFNQSIQYYSCFISYSTKDQDFADRLYVDLQNEAIRCWFAPHDMAAGKKIHEQIDEAIRLHDKLLLILSEDSMNSKWVEHEIRKARKREVADKRRMLFPISLVGFKDLKEWECFDADTGEDLAVEIRKFFIPDFSNWKTDHDAYKKNFELVADSLQTEESTAARA